MGSLLFGIIGFIINVIASLICVKIINRKRYDAFIINYDKWDKIYGDCKNTYNLERDEFWWSCILYFLIWPFIALGYLIWLIIKHLFFKLINKFVYKIANKIPDIEIKRGDNDVG